MATGRRAETVPGRTWWSGRCRACAADGSGSRRAGRIRRPAIAVVAEERQRPARLRRLRRVLRPCVQPHEIRPQHPVGNGVGVGGVARTGLDRHRASARGGRDGGVGNSVSGPPPRSCPSSPAGWPAPQRLGPDRPRRRLVRQLIAEPSYFGVARSRRRSGAGASSDPGSPFGVWRFRSAHRRGVSTPRDAGRRDIRADDV